MLRLSCSSKEQKYNFKESNSLDTVFTYLHKVKKIICKDKQERKLLYAARDEGFWLVLEFHKEFYDKDMEMTDYMCSRESIALLKYAASRNVFSLHHEIPKSEIEHILKYENMIYCSFYAETFRGIWKGKEVVVKVPGTAEGRDFSWTHWYKEITLLSILSHPNICPFYGASTNTEMPFLVMKYIPQGRSLAKLLERERDVKDHKNRVLDTSLIVNMCMNAANGIHYLHQKKLIHQFIRPANFLVDDHYNIFLMNFGITTKEENLSKPDSIAWLAPEILSATNMDQRSDSYSFAIVLWEMVANKAPYSDWSILYQAVFKIVQESYREEIPDGVDPHLAQLIRRLWEQEPDARMEMDHLLEVLYEMRDGMGRFYCRRHEYVPDALMEVVFGFVHVKDLKSLACTSKRFFQIVTKTK